MSPATGIVVEIQRLLEHKASARHGLTLINRHLQPVGQAVLIMPLRAPAQTAWGAWDEAWRSPLFPMNSGSGGAASTAGATEA
jgi:hypothetical protein